MRRSGASPTAPSPPPTCSAPRPPDLYPVSAAGSLDADPVDVDPAARGVRARRRPCIAEQGRQRPLPPGKSGERDRLAERLEAAASIQAVRMNCGLLGADLDSQLDRPPHKARAHGLDA